MSEQAKVSIDSKAATFEQKVFSNSQMRSALEKLEQQAEEQRLLAWAKLQAAPHETELRRAYELWCQEQTRLMNAFNKWRRLNPVPTEVPDAAEDEEA